jgi:RsiW-degrading membrane proteinase PrsW (M82 family)
MQLLTNKDKHPEFSGDQSSIHWLSFWQLVLSLLGMMTLWGFAIMLGFMVLSSAISTGGASSISDSLPLLLMAAGIAFGGILLIPSAGYAFLHILNKPNPIKFKLPRSSLVFILIPLFVSFGYLVTKSPTLTWIALPPIHVITIGLSILWLSSLGIRGLSVGSKQRIWGIFGAGMVAAPILSLLMEFVVIIGVCILGISYFARDPVFAHGLTQLSENYLANPDQQMDALVKFLEPYLMQPITIYGVLIVVAILVPLIEEFFKPIGVWLLIRRKPTPSQGFAAGVLSGAGFALFENFALSASSGEEWSLVVVARMGTSIIHILTTGLTGWALALAWQEGRYFRLGLTYLVSVSIHALWNGLVILSVIPELLPVDALYPDVLRNIGTSSPIVFLILLVGSFVLLLRFNSTLRHAIMSPVDTATPGEHHPTSKIISTDSHPIMNTNESLDNTIPEENLTNGNHQLFD